MRLTRRRLVQVLAALGLGHVSSATPSAQGGAPFSTQDLKGSLAIHGRALDDVQIEVIRRPLQRHLEQFRAVRNLEIDDAIAPVLIFDVRQR